MKRKETIYLTHCCAEKDDFFRETGQKTTPDKLYIEENLQRFIQRCKAERVEWAIFSDKYGIVFPDTLISWYDKHPDLVTESEFENLVEDFTEKLSGYKKIFFYYKKELFHPLYGLLLKEVKKRGLQVIIFSLLDEIKGEI